MSVRFVSTHVLIIGVFLDVTGTSPVIINWYTARDNMTVTCNEMRSPEAGGRMNDNNETQAISPHGIMMFKTW